MPITMKAARINAGLAKKEVCDKLGITEQTLTNYESFRTVPDVKVAMKMVELYKLPIDEIIFFRK